MNLENKQNEKSQTYKVTYHTTSFTWDVQDRQMHGDRKQISGGWGVGAGGKNDCCGALGVFLGFWNVLESDNGGDCTL